MNWWLKALIVVALLPLAISLVMIWLEFAYVVWRELRGNP